MGDPRYFNIENLQGAPGLGEGLHLHARRIRLPLRSGKIARCQRAAAAAYGAELSRRWASMPTATTCRIRTRRTDEAGHFRHGRHADRFRGADRRDGHRRVRGGRRAGADRGGDPLDLGHHRARRDGDPGARGRCRRGSRKSSRAIATHYREPRRRARASRCSRARSRRSTGCRPARRHDPRGRDRQGLSRRGDAARAARHHRPVPFGRRRRTTIAASPIRR